MSAPVGIRALRWVVIVAATAAVVGGLTLSGTPGAERKRQLDERRQGDLQRLADRIDGWYARRHALPPALDALVEPGDRFADPVPLDPVSGAAYEYAVDDSLHYRLCATFDAPSVDAERRGNWLQPMGVNRFWDPPAGRHCFAIRVRQPEPLPDPTRPGP